MSDPVRVVVVMGVSGSGKTTLARALADAWPATFLDADDFHSVEARAHMAGGQPLTDAMRQPWVERIAAELVRRVAAGERIALAFSGLRRRHRDALRASGLPLRFVFLHGEPELVAARMQARRDHYMPVTLLESQYATLEDPRGEPDVVEVPVGLAPEVQLQRSLGILAASS